MYRYFKRLKGKEWRIIFRHKSYENNPVFFTNDLVLNSTNDSERYSILGYVDDSFRINGAFEFLLEYPEYHTYF